MMYNIIQGSSWVEILTASWSCWCNIVYICTLFRCHNIYSILCD